MKRYIIIIALLCLAVRSLFAYNVLLHKKNFRSPANHMMHESSQKSRYWIALKDVEVYLPDQHGIKRRSIKLIDDRMLPGKTALRVVKHFAYDKIDSASQQNTKDIFANLAENKPHTYVITPERLIFTESTSNPSLEVLKDKFTKHFLISGLQGKINYSGEFFVYKNIDNNDVFVVFDNSSGTYQPPNELLPQVQQVLENNLHEENLYFITKSYKQKIDKEKLFAYDKQPFIN